MKIYENGQLRDLTPKELEDIKAFEDEQKKIPNKPTLEEQILALQNALISQKISGWGIKVTDSLGLPVEEFSMSGKTEQNGTPTPTNPVNIEVTPQGIITVDFTDGTNHQIVELNCPREFTKWDRLEKIDGVWNWVFGSRKETFEDASVKNMIDVSDKNTRQFTVRHETDIKDAWSNAYVLSNNFIGVSGNKSYTQSAPYDFYVAYHNKAIVFSSKKLDGIFETKETFQEWLQFSGTYILHKSDEKEFIPLSQSEQDKLNALTMYAPNTEITNDGGCNMELTYTVDTKAYVDAKIAPIVKTILETQKALL